MTESAVAPNQIPKFVEELLTKIIEGEGFTEYKSEYNWEKKHLSTLVKVEVLGKKSSSDEEPQSLNLVCKLPPADPVRRGQFAEMGLFEQEIRAYSTILPAFEKFQNDKDIAEPLGFYKYPKCVYVSPNENSAEAVIIMRDLSAHGFNSLNKLEPVDYVHSKEIMVGLGRLHAISLALKTQQPEAFQELCQAVTSNNKFTEANSPVISKILDASFDRVLRAIDQSDESKVKKVSRLKETAFEELQKCTNSEDCEPYSVISHGDCLTNNLMFKYRNGYPDSIVMLDWQIIRYATPVLDLIHYLFICTDENFRRLHYDNMIQVYYKSFREQLERLGGNPGEQFPYTALIRHLKLFGKYGLIIASLIIPPLTGIINDIAEIKQSNKLVANANIFDNAGDTFRHKINSIINDIIRLGYL